MRKEKIKVYDYDNVLHGNESKDKPKCYEVEAWCVSDFRAIFLHKGGYVVEAKGDDDHWWVVGWYGDQYLKDIADMYHAVLAEVLVKGQSISEHKCKRSTTCQCSLLADEPNEKCPIHGGGEWPPRCEICGRFMKVKYKNEHYNNR